MKSFLTVVVLFLSPSFLLLVSCGGSIQSAQVFEGFLRGLFSLPTPQEGTFGRQILAQDREESWSMLGLLALPEDEPSGGESSQARESCAGFPTLSLPTASAIYRLAYLLM